MQRMACLRAIPPATVSHVPKLSSLTISGHGPSWRDCIRSPLISNPDLALFLCPRSPRLVPPSSDPPLRSSAPVRESPRTRPSSADASSLCPAPEQHRLRSSSPPTFLPWQDRD